MRIKYSQHRLHANFPLSIIWKLAMRAAVDPDSKRVRKATAMDRTGSRSHRIIAAPLLAMIVLALATGPAPAGTGSLRLSSEPLGADIYLDGNARGRTPTTIHRLAPGEYEVVLKKKGYEDHEAAVEIEPGRRATIRAVLRREEVCFIVESNQEDAEIFVDGASYGFAGDQLEAYPGRHEITAAKEGFKDVSKKVVLREPTRFNEDPNTFRIDLKQRGASRVLGSLFDGRTLGTWSTYDGVGMDCWSVEDGALTFRREPDSVQRAMSLGHDTPGYECYVVELECRGENVAGLSVSVGGCGSLLQEADLKWRHVKVTVWKREGRVEVDGRPPPPYFSPSLRFRPRTARGPQTVVNSPVQLSPHVPPRNTGKAPFAQFRSIYCYEISEEEARAAVRGK